MKKGKVIWAGVLSFLTAAIFHAQERTPVFGIKGGMAWSDVTGHEVSRLSNGGKPERLGGQILGLSVNNKVTEHFWLKHDLFYSRRFLNIRINDGVNPAFSSNIKRRCIDIVPASATFHIKGFQVYAGPCINVLLSATIQRKDTAGNLYKDAAFYKQLQKMDAGFIAGLEYEFKQGLTIGAHYLRGFVPITKQLKVFNQYAGFMIGYSFIKH